MKLKLTFKTVESGNEFLKKTGESDLSTVHVGLINMALADVNLESIRVEGDPIEFHVLKNGVWVTELIADPVTRIQSGEVMEPAETPIKMLGSFTTDMVAWKNRIANRYIPFVADPYFAALAAQRNVEVILVDSGINAQHAEFSGVQIEELYKLPHFSDYSDTLGHGTALASIVAGQNLGVNKSAVLKIVKISDSLRKPTLTELGNAIDAIYEYHQTSPSTPKIVNMSWAIPSSQYINDKLVRLTQAGIMLVAAAGNTAINIDDVTPAGSAGVFTVAAANTNEQELVAVYGVNKKLDLYAPGQNIGLANCFDINDYVLGTGSSYAAAMVSGVASLLFGINDTMPSAVDVQAALSKDATFNALILNENVSVGENKLLHRPDTASLDPSHTQYLGCIPIAYPGFLAFDLKVLMPAVIFNSGCTPALSYQFDVPSYGDVLDVTISQAGVLRIVIKQGATIPADVRIQRMSLYVTAQIPGATAETTTCYIFISSPDATTDDTRQALEDLNAITQFAFLEDDTDSGPIKVKVPGSV